MCIRDSYIIDTIEVQKDEEINQEEQNEVLQKLPLPENITELFVSENLIGEYENILAETFIKYLAGGIANFIIGAISLFITFLVINILMRLFGKALDVIVSFPILSMMNRTGGAVLGLSLIHILRDALSLLDQCIAFYLGEKLTYEKVLENLGARCV